MQGLTRPAAGSWDRWGGWRAWKPGAGAKRKPVRLSLWKDRGLTPAVLGWGLGLFRPIAQGLSCFRHPEDSGGAGGSSILLGMEDPPNATVVGSSEVVPASGVAATRAQLFKVFQALLSLTDQCKDGKLRVRIQAISAAPTGFDASWLRNTVQEPFGEADRELRHTPES